MARRPTQSTHTVLLVFLHGGVAGGALKVADVLHPRQARRPAVKDSTMHHMALQTPRSPSCREAAPAVGKVAFGTRRPPELKAVATARHSQSRRHGASQ